MAHVAPRPKEPFISKIISSPVQPGAATRLQRSRPDSEVANWVKCIPFVGLHLACLTVLLTGFSTLGIVLCAVTYFIRMFGITGGYHRYFAHRSYKTSRVGQFLLACLGCSALQKGPLWWAGHHRQHHRFSDTPDDPHSPHVTSFWWSHLGWVLAADHEDTPLHVIRDWARYPELRLLNRLHWLPGILLAVGCFLVGFLTGGWSLGWSTLVWGFLVSTVLVYHATFAINSLSHLLGSRRYATDDESRNNFVLAILTLGEGWHNNHHHYQSSANQGFFWWEIDISYYIIRMLSWAGLVWDIRKPGSRALTYRNVELNPPRSGG